MSVALSSLRGHFFKHPSPPSAAASQLSNLAPPNRLSSIWSAKSLLQKQRRGRTLNSLMVAALLATIHSLLLTCRSEFAAQVTPSTRYRNLEFFHPVEITEGIWIVPEWRGPPNPRAINIILNPGLAFGTGEHPTTKLCLLLLHRSIKRGESFLDYGTDSGILAIAVLKFGADLSVGFDIEPQAIASAKLNAALNDIGPDKLLLSLVPSKNSPHFENGNSTKHDSNNSKIIFAKEKYDVVIANILLCSLLDLADRIVSYAMPGAIVGISGIISEQVPSVIKYYSQFLDNITVSTMEDWACISGSKKSTS